MMEDQKLNLTIDKDFKGKELVIRYDAPKKVYQPKVIEITGTIKAPAEWMKKRKDEDECKFECVHVTYSIDEGFIKLICDERSNFRTTITGRVESFSDLVDFKINRPGSTWHPKQLATFIKMNRIYFQDREENMKIVSNLQKFKAQITQKIEDFDNDRGSKRKVFDQDVKTEMQMTFKLKIPLFKGGEYQTFKVEICYDVSDAGLSYWFESPELKELMDGQKDVMIDKELKEFRKNIVVIEV